MHLPVPLFSFQELNTNTSTHNSCGCGHQFCYLCGERWKTCTCPRHGFGHGRERRQQYRQGHDNIPFIPQAPDPDAFFADPPPLEFVAPPREGEGGAEREQLPGGALVPPPADVEWFPPAQLPEGGAARNGNGNGELIFIDDGTQPRIPGTQYIYDWEVYPGREPWVRRHPAGHPGDHGPEATVQTRWLAEGERVPQDAMPQGGNDNMVFLPQVYSSDEYDSEEEFEEERRRRARRRRRDRRGRHREGMCLLFPCSAFDIPQGSVPELGWLGCTPFHPLTPIARYEYPAIHWQVGLLQPSPALIQQAPRDLPRKHPAKTRYRCRKGRALW